MRLVLFLISAQFQTSLVSYLSLMCNRANPAIISRLQQTCVVLSNASSFVPLSMVRVRRKTGPDLNLSRLLAFCSVKSVG